MLNANAPIVQATCFGIYDVNERETVFGKMMDAKHEVASVTKVMTAYTVTEIARKYKLILSQVHIKVCNTVLQIIGTTANLVEGDVLTAE